MDKGKRFSKSVARWSGFTRVWAQNPLFDDGGIYSSLQLQWERIQGVFLYEIGGKVFVSFPATLFPKEIDDFEIHQEPANQEISSESNVCKSREDKKKYCGCYLIQNQILLNHVGGIFFFYIFHFSNTFVRFFDFFFSLLRWFWKWDDNLRFLHLQFSSITFRFYFCGAQILGILIREEKMK